MSFKKITGLAEIADDYDAVLCDIWGILHDGRDPFPEAIDALERFQSERGPVVLISNSPRPSVAIPEQFRQIGIFNEPWDAIVTSGDATIDELARRAPGPAFKLGPDRDDRIYENLDMNFSDLADAHFISCTGLFNDEDETPDDYVDLLTEALELGLPLICANPDVQVKRGNQIIYCGGALAQLYEKIGGDVVYAGKPHPPIYRLSRAWLKEILGYDITDDRVLTIGDNIFTDVLGAQQEDMDCLFVTGGLHEDKADQLKTLLVEHNITARYMSHLLTW